MTPVGRKTKLDVFNYLEKVEAQNPKTDVCQIEPGKKMDRTMIAPYRAEEKELSQILYNKLQGLGLLHPTSEDLRKLLSDEMFVKPNQQAFFHVMHYLFRLIDQNEFKKRFYWPITDKKSESNFRTSSVEYLKYLNEKHQLNWNNIKSYLVVMPGGMKFISFMLDFVHFIIRELIKQKEKQLNMDSYHQQGMVTEANLQKMCKKDSLFKEMAAGFVDSIDVINKSRKMKMEIITQHMEELAESTRLSLDILTDERFLSEFEDSNSTLFDVQITDRTDKVFDMEKRVVELKECMDKFYSKEAGFKCDKQKLRHQLKRLREEYSLENVTEASLASDDGITINTLIKTFNGIIETIQNELATVDKRPRTGIVHTRLMDIQKDLKDVETQITEFLMVVKSKVKKRQEFETRTPVRSVPLIKRSIVDARCTKLSLENTLLMKYVATPPIKLEISGGQHGPSRLSLLDSKVTGNTTSTFGSFLAPSRNVRQAKLNSSVVEQSSTDLNSTMNRSKLIDPMQLLRSINKDTSKIAVTPKSNISSLGSKWKERQSLFTDKENEVPATPTIREADSNCTPNMLLIQRSAAILETSPSRPLFSEKEGDASSTSTLIKRSFATSGSSTIIQSPMTPFGSNDRTRIARSQLQLLDANSFTGGGGVNQSTSNSWTYVKKLSAVKKVQDASLNFANLSTSPSGRLEPLVTAEDFNIPKLKLNDLSLIDHNVSINKSTTNIKDIDASILEDEGNSDKSMDTYRNKHSKENRNEEEEDAIFNVSDSIMKDVPM